MSFKSFWDLLDSYTAMQISTEVVSNHGAYKSKFIHHGMVLYAKQNSYLNPMLYISRALFIQ